MDKYERLLPFRIAEFAAHLAAGKIPAERVLFDLRSGDDYIGLTELELFATGKCRIKSNQTKGLALVWRTAAVAKSKVRGFVQSFNDKQVWNFPSTRPGMPDERGITIVLRYRSRMWSRTLWLREVETDPGWIAFHDSVQKIVDAAGQGKVLDWAD